MKKILLTGFEPFGNDTINPSWEAVQRFAGKQFGDYEIITHKLSCTFEHAHLELHALIKQYQPQVVLNVGQAGGRAQISLEKVAINWIDARIADNQGLQPIDKEIIANSATAYFSNLPLKSILARLQQNGIPSAISYSAGTFVCNYLFYQLMQFIYTEQLQLLGGFIHIPYLPEQVIKQPNQPSMGIETIVSGLEEILQEIANPQEYSLVTSGTIC